jgi:hypothetical protein
MTDPRAGDASGRSARRCRGSGSSGAPCIPPTPPSAGGKPVTEQFSETLLCWGRSGFNQETPYAWTATIRPAKPWLNTSFGPPCRCRSSPMTALGGKSRTTLPSIRISNRTRTCAAPRISSRTLPSSFVPEEYTPSTTTGCAPHGARRGGSADLTSLVSPPMGGGCPTQSRCPRQPMPRSTRWCRTPLVAQH